MRLAQSRHGAKNSCNSGALHMNRAIRTTIAALALFGLNCTAEASVAPTFSVNPLTVTEGQQSTLGLSLGLTADPGYFHAYFTDVSVTLDFGIGPKSNFGIAYGGTSQSFSQAFTYPTAGNYNPGYSYAANYAEQYFYYVQQSYYQKSGYTSDYSCNYLILCHRWVDTSHWVDTSYWTVLTANFTATGSGSGALTVDTLAAATSTETPLPAALPLFASGAGVLGLLGWRRKRKAVAATA